MKRTLIAICITTVALAIGAIAEEEHPKAAAAGKGKAAATTSAHVNRGGNVHRSRQFSVRQNQNVSARTGNRHVTVNNRQTNAQAAMTRSNVKTNNRVTTRERGFRNQATVDNHKTVTTNSTANRRFAREQNVQQQRVVGATTNRNVTVNRTRNVNRNVTVVNRWQGARFAGPRYTAFRNYHRTWHDRVWWDNHYGTSLTFVFGAPYFWSSGFWYPAWGYNPGYVYPYDGPIYGARNLTPDQIVANVQTQLRNDGYYDGAIDGQLGPQTRQALADFQADNGLAVTSAVDEPTLATLGLV
jgi:hypothetical protein